MKLTNAILTSENMENILNIQQRTNLCNNNEITKENVMDSVLIFVM